MWCTLLKNRIAQMFLGREMKSKSSDLRCLAKDLKDPSVVSTRRTGGKGKKHSLFFNSSIFKRKNFD